LQPELKLKVVTPIVVELVSPEGTSGQVGLMITSTVGAFERVRTWFALLGLES